jgi:Gpi18-like mannosyltransferase
MFLATGAWAFVSKRPTIAGALFALALLTKMQAVALMPLFFVLYLRGGWRIFLRGILGGIAVTVPVLLPFALGKTLGTVIDVYHGSVGFYSMVSSAAYNFWWSLYGDEAGNLQDTQYLFGIMTFRSFGLMMFGLSYLYASVMLWKHLRVTGSTYAKLLPTVYMSGAFVALAFFLWNTQMHERYLFPFVALGLPMTFIDRRGALIYFFVSLLFYMNLIGWLPAGTIDKKLYAEFTTLDVFIAAAQVICYFEFVYYLWVYRTNNPVPVLKRSSPGFFKKIKRLIPRVKPS